MDIITFSDSMKIFEEYGKGLKDFEILHFLFFWLRTIRNAEAYHGGELTKNILSFSENYSYLSIDLYPEILDGIYIGCKW